MRPIKHRVEGLTNEFAAERFTADGSNEITRSARKSLVFDLLSRLPEPLNLALVIAGLLTVAISKERFQGSTIVLLALIGGVLERRADDASAELGRLMSHSLPGNRFSLKSKLLIEGTLEVVEVVAEDGDQMWALLLRSNDAIRTFDEIDSAVLRVALGIPSIALGELVHLKPFDPVHRTMTTTAR